MPSTKDDRSPTVLHASAVAVGNRALLITGASGTGKSGLALQLVALGAKLVADDGVAARRRPEGGLLLTCPVPTRGLIEARGVGLLQVPFTEAALAVAAVDLDRTETARLPEPQDIVIAGETIPLLQRVEGPAFASILLLYLRGGMAER